MAKRKDVVGSLGDLRAPDERKRVPVLLNAMHTVSGGGKTYLEGILPYLAKDNRFAWGVLVNEALVGEVDIPAGVKVHKVSNLGFGGAHGWEQLKLPALVRKWGYKAVLCNANYVPLLAPKPMPILHTTLRASAGYNDWGMWVYWLVLRVMTTLALLRGPVAFTVARFAVRDYLPAWWPVWLGNRVAFAPPAVPDVSGVGKVEIQDGLVVTVGDFYPQKNYPLLLRAIALLREQRKDVRLVIIGRPVDKAVEVEVKRQVKDLGLEKVVEIVEGLPHAKLVKRLAAAHVYVTPSLYETVHIPLLEAMALGVPVVAADAPHTREFVADAGILVKADAGGDVAAAFAVAMLGVMEHRAIADALRNRGVRKVTDLTWEKTAAVIADGVARRLGIG